MLWWWWCINADYNDHDQDYDDNDVDDNDGHDSDDVDAGFQGKFEYNGGCGYLLKPEFMCRSHFMIIFNSRWNTGVSDNVINQPV